MTVGGTFHDEIERNAKIISTDERILVTGAGGFIGRKVVEKLHSCGFHNLRLFARPSGGRQRQVSSNGANSEYFVGNLQSREDCVNAVRDVAVIYHLAAGRGEKSVPDAFMNSVVTTRNLLDAASQHRGIKRFVSISSFSVYTNSNKPNRRVLDESCPVEDRPELRGDAYCFAKVGQDEMVRKYWRSHGVPAVIVRPGWVYGPGNEAITGRVGIGTFGLFLHLGGANVLPATYVDNCADAIVLAGLVPGIEGEEFNVVDDNLPRSRDFLRAYKSNVRRFSSMYVPHVLSYALCFLWEWYANWSHGQLPPVFNRRTWNAYWKATCYSNVKIKQRLGWAPEVPTSVGLERYFESCRNKAGRAA